MDVFKSIARSLFRGLAAVHEANVVHRDLKPENILLKGDEAMLADFGQAKMLVKDGASTPFCTSRYYRAPELILASYYYDESVDVWAAGTILFELFTKVVMFHARKEEAETLIEIQQILGPPTKNDLNQLANQFGVDKQVMINFRNWSATDSSQSIDIVDLMRPR